MNTKQKKALYESIMKSVAKEVKKALNEYKIIHTEFTSINDFKQFCQNKLLSILKGEFDGLNDIEKQAFKEFILNNVDWSEGDNW